MNFKIIGLKSKEIETASLVSSKSLERTPRHLHFLPLTVLSRPWKDMKGEGVLG